MVASRAGAPLLVVSPYGTCLGYAALQQEEQDEDGELATSDRRPCSSNTCPSAAAERTVAAYLENSRYPYHEGRAMGYGWSPRRHDKESFRFVR